MRTVLIILCVVVGVPLVALGLFLLVNNIPPAPPARRFIADAQGRVLVLHGINVNAGGKGGAR